MKKIFLILTVIMFFVSFSIIYFSDRTVKFSREINDLKNISIKCGDNIISCNYKINDSKIKFKINPIKTGKTKITYKGQSISTNGDIVEENSSINVYVHPTGVITLKSYFGKCNGDVSFVISFYILLILMIINLIIGYKKSIKNNLYSYRNIRILGLIIFLIIPTIFNTFLFIYDFFNNYYESIDYIINNLTDNMYFFLFFIFPPSFILTILVSISNFILIKREGKRWTNILGILLGGFICISTLISCFLICFSYHNIYSLIFIYIFAMIITYLECIFFGTCILGIIAAKHIPKFDKDAIIILGCQIKKDGTLTPLLKGRVDRAIEFSKMQKEKTGKDIIFVPSGGQGSDEIMSEAEAMKNYLISQGIKKENILVEDKSKNTYENIKFSNRIINNKIKNPIVAFSTTNYHVFRAGIISSDQNMKMEGIGSKTKTYYWVNAFIREFIATLVNEKKVHIKILTILSILIIIITLITSFN